MVGLPTRYTLPSGNEITVDAVVDGKVFYSISGVRSLIPLSKPLEDFLEMVKTGSATPSR